MHRPRKAKKTHTYIHSTCDRKENNGKKQYILSTILSCVIANTIIYTKRWQVTDLHRKTKIRIMSCTQTHSHTPNIRNVVHLCWFFIMEIVLYFVYVCRRRHRSSVLIKFASWGYATLLLLLWKL